MLQFGEAVVRAPLKTTLNKWTMKKMTESNAARHLKTAFDRHEEWGLALLLVHEFMHGARRGPRPQTRARGAAD